MGEDQVPGDQEEKDARHDVSLAVQLCPAGSSSRQVKRMSWGDLINLSLYFLLASPLILYLHIESKAGDTITRSHHPFIFSVSTGGIISPITITHLTHKVLPSSSERVLFFLRAYREGERPFILVFFSHSSSMEYKAENYCL